MPQTPANSQPLPLVAILGPTASGKSALAVRLAQHFNGEVIACDSAQVYRGFDIGTGKPTLEERGGVPHHMLDVVAPDELFTAGEYRARVLQVLGDLRRRGKLPIFTVGTGLYLRALLDGLADAPARSETLRARLADSAARRGGEHLHRVLRRLDPSAAARISANDRQKIVRALEVTLLTRKPMSAVLAEGRQPLQGYFAIKIGLQPARAALYARINRRVAAMLERGWAREVESLLQGSASPAAKPFEFIGYRELRACLEQGLPTAGARDAIAQATRRYAKRQLTWFRKEPGVHWLPDFGDDETMFTAAVTEIESAHQPSGAAPPTQQPERL